jgi:hypothetical protein
MEHEAKSKYCLHGRDPVELLFFGEVIFPAIFPRPVVEGIAQ